MVKPKTTDAIRTAQCGANSHVTIPHAQATTVAIDPMQANQTCQRPPHGTITAVSSANTNSATNSGSSSPTRIPCTRNLAVRITQKPITLQRQRRTDIRPTATNAARVNARLKIRSGSGAKSPGSYQRALKKQIDPKNSSTPKAIRSRVRSLGRSDSLSGEHDHASINRRLSEASARAPGSVAIDESLAVALVASVPRSVVNIGLLVVSAPTRKTTQEECRKQCRGVRAIDWECPLA